MRLVSYNLSLWLSRILFCMKPLCRATAHFFTSCFPCSMYAVSEKQRSLGCSASAHSSSLEAVVPACGEGWHPTWLRCPWLRLWRHSNTGLWRHGRVWEIHQQPLWTSGTPVTFLQGWLSPWCYYEEDLDFVLVWLRLVAGCGRSWSPEHPGTVHPPALGLGTASLLLVTSVTCSEGWPMIVKTPTATYQGAVQTHTVHNVNSLFSLGFSAMQKKKKKKADWWFPFDWFAGREQQGLTRPPFFLCCIKSWNATNPLVITHWSVRYLLGLMVTHLVKE